MHHPWLNLENRKQRIVPFSHFLLRLLRYSIFALMLISISVWIGMVGYHHYAAFGWLDSFHMSCMILTGMGPVEAMPNARAKMFSSLYALYSGIAFLSICAVFFTPIVHRLLHILHMEENSK